MKQIKQLNANTSVSIIKNEELFFMIFNIAADSLEKESYKERNLYYKIFGGDTVKQYLLQQIKRKKIKD